MRDRVNVLVISGSMGSGKTTVLGEASDLLTLADIPHAAVEMDSLANGHLPPGAIGIEGLNLAAMWKNFATQGIARLLLAEALDSADKLRQIRDAIPGAQITVCRVRATIRTMQQRVRMREPGLLQEWFVARVVQLEESLDAAAIEDFSVENDSRSITEVAREMLRRAAWLKP